MFDGDEEGCDQPHSGGESPLGAPGWAGWGGVLKLFPLVVAKLSSLRLTG